MYYASIGVLGLLILFINNYYILFRKPAKELDAAHKAYKAFLICIAAFYIIDFLWAPIFYIHNTIIHFTETSLYFVIMALTVLFWTKYVILYLNENNLFAKILKITGWVFLIVQIIVLVINIFIPIAFWFDEDGSYHTSIARNINLSFQIIMFLIITCYMFGIVFKTEGKIKHRHRAIGVDCIIMMLFIFLQALYPMMPFYSIGCMLGTCMLHTFVLEDEKEARREQLESILKVEQIQEMELGKTRKMAYSDPLTGVKNKMAYLEDIGSIEQKIEDGFLHDFGLVVFDLNDLKTTNDNFGHDAGDKYIKEGCSLICNSFKHSPVYRIGGDEFVVFLSGEDYKNRDKILITFNNTIEENLKSDGVIVAFGFADYATMAEKGFMRLFEHADKKMYECKEELKAKKLQISM